MGPGAAVAFHYRTLHGTRRNTSANRRRAFSLRLVGDDARYVERPGPTSPPTRGCRPEYQPSEDEFQPIRRLIRLAHIVPSTVRVCVSGSRTTV